MKNSYVAKVAANRSVLMHLALLFALSLLLLFAAGFAFDAYRQAGETEKKIEMMKEATEAYARKKTVLDKAVARPVTAEAIDGVQTGILKKLQEHHLGLARMSSPAQNEKERNRVFEMEITGSYENTMAFLSGLSKGKALIAVLSLSFQPDKETLKTSVKYKVYVR